MGSLRFVMTTANQREIRKAYPASVMAARKMDFMPEIIMKKQEKKVREQYGRKWSKNQ